MKKTFIALSLLLSTILYGSSVTVNGSSGGGTWGSITGTLSNQTDLQAVLDTKGSGTVTGTGTTGRVSQFASTTSVGNTNWAIGTNGQFGWTDYTAQKGSRTAPLIDLVNTGTAGTGMYTDTTGNLLMTVNGQLTAGINYDYGGLSLHASNSATTFHAIYSASDMFFRAIGVGKNGYYHFTPGTDAATTNVQIRFGPFSAQVQEFYANTLAHTTAPGLFGIYGYSIAGGSTGSYVLFGTRGGGVITGYEDRANAFTIVGQADVSDIDAGVSNCTTTVNASTTVTGSANCKFLNDFGLGDLVSVSSASTTYVRVTAVASNTSMTVSANLGDGSTQTLNRKQTLLSVQKNDRSIQYEVDANGNAIFAKSISTTPTTVDLTADDQAVTANASSHIRFTSDNATATNRTIVLGDGAHDGQRLLLEWNESAGTGAGELTEAAGNVNLSASWTPDIGDTLELTWNLGASEWREITRANN